MRCSLVFLVAAEVAGLSRSGALVLVSSAAFPPPAAAVVGKGP